ncbi:MAG: hypothetical protein R3F23_03285 [Verrucomicrobiia bacterium]
MFNKNNNSVTLNLGNLVEKFKTATQIVARSGLSIPMDKVIEVMILSELNRLDPNDIAKRFKRAVIKTLSKVSEHMDEEENDEEDSFLENESAKNGELLTAK